MQLINSLTREEHRFVVGSLCGVAATAGVFWLMTRRADEQAIASSNKHQNNNNNNKNTISSPTGMISNILEKKKFVRLTPSFIQTSIFTINTAAWLFYGLYLKHNNTSLNYLSRFKSFILDNDQSRSIAFNFLTIYHAAVYYPCWIFLAYSTVSSLPALRKNRLIRLCDRYLRHPISRLFVQCIGYGGVWYSIFKDILISDIIKTNCGPSTANDLSRANSVSSRGLGTLPFVLGTFGQYYGALHLLNAFCVSNLQQKPLFSFVNINVSIYAALIVKAFTFLISIMDKTGYFDGIGNILSTIKGLNVLEQMYGVYNVYNVVYVILNKMFPQKMDDYYVKSPKAMESLFLMFGTLFLMGIMRLRGGDGMESDTAMLRNIFLNEVYFYALPVFYFIEYTLRHKEITQIEKNLFISNLVTASQKEIIDKYNIKHIIELHGLSGTNDVVHKKINYLVIEAIDRAFTTDLIDHFNQTNLFIKKGVSKNQNVLIHCRYGVSRSSTIIMAYLIGELGYEWDEAIDRMNQLRMQFDPNNGYMMQLREYYEECKELKNKHNKRKRKK